MESPLPSSQALTKRNADTQLMPPPPRPKRIKRPSQVVDEEVYTDALSHIIARDFFPGLLESEAQQEYLEALDSNDKTWIRDAGRKLHQAMTPGRPGARRGTSLTPSTSQTPRAWQGATPARTPSVAPSTAASEAPTPPVDTSLSLGAFQARYTSEDNESFNSLLDRQNQKRAEKYAFMYHGNKLPSKQQLAQQKLLTQNASSSAALALVKRPSDNLNDRRANFDSFPNRQGPRNTFMFDPDGIEDTHETVALAAQKASVAPPKAISYTSTRLPTTSSETDPSIPPSPSISAIDAAIAGRPRPSDTSTGYSGAETPRVNGYTFVDATPQPHEYPGIPVTDAEAEAEERASALALLPSYDPDADNNPFKLQATSKREEIHHRLVDKSNVTRRKPGVGGRLDFLRGDKGQARTPTPKFATSPAVGGRTPGIGAMTPAARALAKRIGGTPGRVGGVFDGMGKSKSWTPTPRVKKSGG